ncbi:MAG: hypothetical protein AAGI44_03065 [Pseudomonadota bacterium]
MAIVKEKNDPWAQTAKQAATRHGYAARSELALRQSMEDLFRERMPGARVVHEIVMGEGRARADMASIGTDTIEAVEVKGSHDDTTRLLHQVGMFQLCVPTVWVVASENHAEDVRLIKHLLPSIGVIIGKGMDRHFYNEDGRVFDFEVESEPGPFSPPPEMMLRLMWAEEMRSLCDRVGLDVGARATRRHMETRLLSTLTPEEIKCGVCTDLRARDALWRADDPVPIEEKATRRDE